MPDPNAKLVKEIQDLTRALEANTKQLKESNRLAKSRPQPQSEPTSFVTYQDGPIDDNSNSDLGTSGDNSEGN